MPISGSTWVEIVSKSVHPALGPIETPLGSTDNKSVARKPLNLCAALKPGLKGLRFHVLRHQAISELLGKGLSDQATMEVAGHVSREMLAHYSQMCLNAKRVALKMLETLLPEKSKSLGTRGVERNYVTNHVGGIFIQISY
jgi:hypothetical protein